MPTRREGGLEGCCYKAVNRTDQKSSQEKVVASSSLSSEGVWLNSLWQLECADSALASADNAAVQEHQGTLIQQGNLPKDVPSQQRKSGARLMI